MEKKNQLDDLICFQGGCKMYFLLRGMMRNLFVVAFSITDASKAILELNKRKDVIDGVYFKNNEEEWWIRD